MEDLNLFCLGGGGGGDVNLKIRSNAKKYFQKLKKTFDWDIKLFFKLNTWQNATKNQQ